MNRADFMWASADLMRSAIEQAAKDRTLVRFFSAPPPSKPKFNPSRPMTDKEVARLALGGLLKVVP